MVNLLKYMMMFFFFYWSIDYAGTGSGDAEGD
jgi:hypothetical protein